MAVERYSLVGRRAYVTGAASGIGRALVRALLAEKTEIVAIDKNAEALARLKDECRLLGFELAVAAADVADRTSFFVTLEKIAAEHGEPNLFINNAGITVVGEFAATSAEAFEAVLRVNIDGVVTGSRFALSRATSGGMIIVNMASIAGHLPAAFMTSYSASKFAVVGFTRALQAELAMAHSPARVVLVSPGFIDTPIMKHEQAPFPWFLRWMVTSPARCAERIVAGLKRGDSEIYPDPGGRLMKLGQRLAPQWTAKASRLLVAKTLPELFGKAPIRIAP